MGRDTDYFNLSLYPLNMPSTSYHWLLPTTTRSDEKIIGFSKLIPFFLTVYSIVIEKALCWRPSVEFSFSFDAQRFGIWFWYLEKYFNGDAQYCVGEVFHWRSTVLWWRRPSIDDQGKGIGVSEVKRYYGWEVFHVIVMMHSIVFEWRSRVLWWRRPSIDDPARHNRKWRRRRRQDIAIPPSHILPAGSSSSHKVPRNKDINVVIVIASNDCVAILPLIS